MYFDTTILLELSFHVATSKL